MGDRVGIAITLASGVVMVVLLAASFGHSFGYSAAIADFRIQAVKHNAARFVIVNPATGATAFKWNDELEK